MEQRAAHSSISDYLGQPLELGDPVVSGPLTVFPVFGPEPRQNYISLKDAMARGLSVKELPGGGSVRDLVVNNPGRHNVLIFEGEEVLGAQQNRTFDIGILLAAGSREVVPVSCVEAGRWDGSRNREEFTASPQTAHPKMRGEKVKQSNRARMSGVEARADQGMVWEQVSERAAELGTQSPTGALHHAYESRRDRLREITGPIDLVENQIGSVCVIGGEVRAVDVVSRPEVFADLHPALLQGYALDAIVSPDSSGEVSVEEVAAFIEQAGETRILEGDGIGLGRDFRFESPELVGAGVISGEELIQLSVFPGDNQRPGGDDVIRPIYSRPTRIARPSRRRNR